ncbi:hypothetical protein ACFOU0_06020 [Salinicoccus sesuvii]|uniref:Uncharacterized protein n=1 Tax=Salinicoccus sesuvii TaxID=868281 RepID=A0ABV7N3E6_9STAP
MADTKMRDISKTEELITRTFGVDYDEVKFNKMDITDKHLTFNLEWTHKDALMQATITEKAVKPKFTLEERDDEFVLEQLNRLFYMRDELFIEDEEKINDDIFEGQEYDPARGYVEKDKKDEQVALDMEQVEG